MKKLSLVLIYLIFGARYLDVQCLVLSFPFKYHFLICMPFSSTISPQFFSNMYITRMDRMLNANMNIDELLHYIFNTINMAFRPSFKLEQIATSVFNTIQWMMQCTMQPYSRPPHNHFAFREWIVAFWTAHKLIHNNNHVQNYEWVIMLIVYRLFKPNLF